MAHDLVVKNGLVVAGTVNDEPVLYDQNHGA